MREKQKAKGPGILEDVEEIEELKGESAEKKVEEPTQREDIEEKVEDPTRIKIHPIVEFEQEN